MDFIIIGLLIPTLIAAVGAPVLVYRRLRKVQQAEIEKLHKRLEENMGAAVKLLEVRSYYDEASATLKKMLQDAYKEGNRFRQDQIRKLIDRLNALKVRTVDKTVRILDPTTAPAPRKRRRRSRRPRRQSPNQANSEQSKKPTAGDTPAGT